MRLIPLSCTVATAGLLLVGCTEAPSENLSASEGDVSTENGLIAVNGLSALNGLKTTGLSSTVGMMTTAAGRTTVSYLARCALPAGTTLVKKDQYGASYSFPGSLGFAPEWADGACNDQCQEYVSACLMAHINTTGAHVPLWIVAAKTGVGWSLNSDYPNMEGSFFGNIFGPSAHGYNGLAAFYCNGKAFDKDTVPGRIGSAQTGAPYINPYLSGVYATSTSGYCADHCTASDYPNATSGYKACSGWNNVVTVYRKGATGGTITAAGSGTAATLTATITPYLQNTTGYCANVNVTNKGSTTVSSWTVTYDTGSAYQWYNWFGFDNASGSLHTTSGSGSFYSIPPGTTRTFGFCALYKSGVVSPVIKSVTTP